jgi:hypothetical protein
VSMFHKLLSNKRYATPILVRRKGQYTNNIVKI